MQTVYTKQETHQRQDRHTPPFGPRGHHVSPALPEGESQQVEGEHGRVEERQEEGLAEVRLRARVDELCVFVCVRVCVCTGVCEHEYVRVGGWVGGCGCLCVYVRAHICASVGRGLVNSHRLPFPCLSP